MEFASETRIGTKNYSTKEKEKKNKKKEENERDEKKMYVL